jgi:hypothetical protein
MLQTEQREQGIIDLRPGEGASYLVRENRGLMIGRVKHLERYGLANDVEPGRWGRFRPRRGQLDGAFRAQRRHQDCNSTSSC